MADEKEEWHNIGNGTRMKAACNGKIIVVAPENLKQTVVPLFCPLCELPMLTREDGHSFRKTSCCERCELRWGSAKLVLGEEIDLVKKSPEWKEYMSDRLKRSRQLIKLK